MSNWRQILGRCEPLKAAYHGARAAGFRVLLAISPALLARVRYWLARRRWPDFVNPATLDEKLLWLNLYWRHPLKAECGDKYTMRGYVERQGLEHLLPRLHAVYDAVEEINFDTLPIPCVLKCSHGCKCNVFCRSAETLDVAAARRDLRRWMRTDFSRLLGELHYADMRPRIICEEFLDDGSGQLPSDYKVYCFGGKPYCILCCTERQPNGKAQFGFFDLDWHPLSFMRIESPVVCKVPRPKALPEMIEAAAALATPFPFVRVDFYCIGDRAVLGELTFTPDACIDTDLTDEAQRTLGNLLLLPAPLLAAEAVPRRCWRQHSRGDRVGSVAGGQAAENRKHVGQVK